MHDSAIVAAIVAGDPDALAAAYDKYATHLYTYCRSLLHEPADAADAVQDTFVIAASRLAGLRNPERLRAWLYAVARNECHRRLRERATVTPLGEVPDVTDESAEIGAGLEHSELRALVRAAMNGLNPAEREVAELQLRQGLDVAEIADVLGISRNHAHALISRARDQLEISLGVLLVARHGREACAELDTLLKDWDGTLSVPLRKRLHRHIDRCPVCGERKRSALRPALMLGLAPLAALPSGLAAPSGLRERVLHLAASSRPDAAAHRAAIAARTGPFGEHGFPKPLDPPRTHLVHLRPVHAAAAAAAVAVVAVVAVVAGGGPQRSTTAGGTAPGATGPAATRPGSARPGTTGPGATSSGGTGPGAGVASVPAGNSPGPASSPAVTAVPSSGSTSSGGGSPSPSASGGSPSPSPSGGSSSPVPPGTITVSPATILLSLLSGSTLTITAQGGPVSWSISEPSSLIGEVNYYPAAGTLQAGQQAQVIITVSGIASVDSTLTVNPGGHAVTVVLGVL